MSVDLVKTEEKPVDLQQRMETDHVRVTVREPTSYPPEMPPVIPPLWSVVVRAEDRALHLPYYTTVSFDAPTPVEVMRDLITIAQSIEDCEGDIYNWANVPPGTRLSTATEHMYHWYVEQTAGLFYVLSDRYSDYLYNTRI